MRLQMIKHFEQTKRHPNEWVPEKKRNVWASAIGFRV